MQASPLKTLALAGVLCATAACSQSANNSASSGGANSVPASSADNGATASAAPLDCSKVFASSDVAGILTGAIKIERDQYPIGCHFDGSGASVSVDVDPSLEVAWDPAVAGSGFVDLPGVGDQARWHAASGDVLSRKGKLYCGAEFSMQSTPASLSGEELAKRLGALCNKLFAASP